MDEHERELLWRAASKRSIPFGTWMRDTLMEQAKLILGFTKPEPPAPVVLQVQASAAIPAVEPEPMPMCKSKPILPYPVPSTPPPISEEDAAETERQKAAMRQLAADPEEMARREREYRELLSREGGAHNPAPDHETA